MYSVYYHQGRRQNQGTGVAEVLRPYEIPKPPSRRPSSIRSTASGTADNKPIIPTEDRKKIGSRALADAAYLQLNQPMVGGSGEVLDILEEQIKAVANRQSYLVEEERANRQRIQGALKVSNEQISLVVNDLASKVAALELILGKKENNEANLIARVYVAYHQQIRNSDEINKQMHGFLQAFQFQTEKELAQIRNSLNDSTNESHANNTKNKEKHAALFAELVRLGKDFESFSEGITTTLTMLNKKIQTIESKADKTAAENINTTSMGNDFTGMLVKYTERSETRFSQLESNFSILAVVYKTKLQEEIKSVKDSEAKTEVQQMRSIEDVKEIIKRHQQDVTAMY